MKIVLSMILFFTIPGFAKYIDQPKEKVKYTTIKYSDYLQMSSKEKSDYISESREGNQIYSEMIPLLPLSQEQLQKLELAETKMNTKNYDSSFGYVGDVSKWIDVYFSTEGKYIGASIQYEQYGCIHYDENEVEVEKFALYSTRAQALLNDCRGDEVSWEGYSYLDENFQEIYHDEQLEWSGF